MPNQLTIEADDPAAAARAAEHRVASAWRKITDAVWARIDKAARHGRGTRETWERQLGSFWQVHWAVGGGEELARRKAWRGRFRQAEPGGKYTLMAGWQELSGYHRIDERARQEGFWRGLRQVLPTFDLNEDERLCALALVKRLFPSVAARAIGWKLDAVHWPSTPYLAARPWMEDVLRSSTVRADAEAYADLVVDEAPPAHQQEKGADRIHVPEPDLARSRFLRLDGSYVFVNDLKLADRTPLTDDDPDLRDELARLLIEVCDEAAAAGRQRQPSAFYALLQLDGDRLGKLLGESEHPAETSRALARFAREAVVLVRAQQGLPVYAGGDDLVAFLPLPTALATTVALAALYESILQPTAKPDSRVTTSAALVFAHCRSPLRSVVAEGHRMLDEDAKESNGRGSVAVAVWKASGVTTRWVTTWEQLVPGWRSAAPSGNGVASHRVCTVSGRVGDAEVSKSFLYGQREVLTRLAGREPWRPGLVVELPEGVAPEALVRAELARARDENPEEVAEVARELTELMRPGRRDRAGHSEVLPGRLAFDPLLLAHFLNAESPGGAR